MGSKYRETTRHAGHNPPCLSAKIAAGVGDDSDLKAQDARNRKMRGIWALCPLDLAPILV
jgi:hypothetical protein